MSTSTNMADLAAGHAAGEPRTASDNAVTSVASRSTVTSPPPVPGVASPASCQARSQAASHATRIVLSALRRILGQDGDQPGHHRV